MDAPFSIKNASREIHREARVHEGGPEVSVNTRPALRAENEHINNLHNVGLLNR